MLNPEKIFISDPTWYITSAIKKDKVKKSHSLILLKSLQMFHKDLQMFSDMGLWDMGYICFSNLG